MACGYTLARSRAHPSFPKSLLGISEGCSQNVFILTLAFASHPSANL